jgi:hypothetical protein
MNEEQIKIISKLTRDDAIDLYLAGEVWTWVTVCETIQEVARAKNNERLLVQINAYHEGSDGVLAATLQMRSISHTVW